MKTKWERKELSYRKIDAIDIDNFCNELYLNQLKALPLEDKIKQFSSELTRVLDKLIHLKTRTITLCPFNPRFTDKVRSQKGKMRNCE